MVMIHLTYHLILLRLMPNCLRVSTTTLCGQTSLFSRLFRNTPGFPLSRNFFLVLFHCYIHSASLLLPFLFSLVGLLGKVQGRRRGM